MFIVNLTYIKPLTEIDALIPGHRAFLEKYYATGNFLLSGRKEPRTGGVLLATFPDKTTLETIIQEDPFYQAGVANYDIIEMIPTMSAPELSNLLSKS
jgi:uncharacterized protein YciI